MKIIYAVLSAFLLSAVQAYTPPADQPDGAYSVSFDANGNPITKRHEIVRSDKMVHSTRRGRIPADVNISPNTNLKRDSFPGQQVGCTQRDISDHYAYSVVQNCLGTWLDENNGQDATDPIYYCRDGDTLLAICAYAATIAGSPAEIDTCGA